MHFLSSRRTVIAPQLHKHWERTKQREAHIVAAVCRKRPWPTCFLLFPFEGWGRGSHTIPYSSCHVCDSCFLLLAWPSVRFPSQSSFIPLICTRVLEYNV
ncbi:hypothetical protein CVT26_009188 [Gymnopilus dilepis]|uniref:Uncharacterized protein n=1 Tax=Gymnopilus dilepis TaxID=231916 RepID=A0A409X4B9_9AGAR|nr:hypothetical protein CVT26_009188 [Gymnopilus dilepis]